MLPKVEKNLGFPRRSPKKADEIHAMDDILDDLCYLLSGFPEAAIEAAIQKQNEISPVLPNSAKSTVL